MLVIRLDNANQFFSSKKEFTTIQNFLWQSLQETNSTSWTDSK